MMKSLAISIDAMGGDHGPSVVVPGVLLAAKQAPNLRFILHGNEAAIRTQFGATLPSQVEIRHAERVIAMDEKPAQALRRGKGTSMWAAVEAVKTGEAAAAVSAGNTGALMAICLLLLRMSVDVDRPCLVVGWPGTKGITTVLDVGANVDCDAERLVEFAIMGEAFHRAAHGVAKPTVGLLNVGSEDMKGHEEVRQAHAILRGGQFDLDYRGFVEGDGLSRNVVDVVVTDGFTGNIALKTAEGTARYLGGELRAALTGTALSKLGALLARPGLLKFREKLSPDAAAPLLGLNGVVVKSHGGAADRDIAAAIRMASKLAQSDFAAEIERNMTRLTAAVAEHQPPAVDGAA
ncbi:MAG: phosphate acyltransferase PlsX [Phenylobacterium sp.]|uniref:phosphate acyltransferase PlsX n=1 Tax=Phenylobacterium sp. TaxID=1871053 RepID=UPI0027374D2F|nr:phosphate acyltransferase PlsX [Phenylobacterium sp.]MDP3747843.1 phosphate acyltransferase PlsX [Phenylobacterium sp.]